MHAPGIGGMRTAVALPNAAITSVVLRYLTIEYAVCKCPKKSNMNFRMGQGIGFPRRKFPELIV
jgi:hypothetical protein